MEHVKVVTATQIFELHNQTFQSKRLHNMLSKSGEKVWASSGLDKVIVEAKLTGLLGTEKGAQEVAQNFEKLSKYHNELLKESLPVMGIKFPKEDVKNYLSVLRHLLPPSDDFGREALQEIGKRLGLGSLIKEEHLKPHMAKLSAEQAQKVRA